MKEIQLTQGKVTIVDDGDYAVLSQFNWCATWTGKKWYATRVLPRTEKYKLGKKVYMHRIILGTEFQVDHRNGDGLDNRRDNLRPATRSQNSKNRGKQKDNTSGFKGVTKASGARRRTDKWVATIKHDGSSTIYIGIYPTPEEAARAYDCEAKKLHGEFAKLNFEMD